MMFKKSILVLLLLLTAGGTFAQSRVVLYEDFYDNAFAWKEGYSGSSKFEIKDGYYYVERKSERGFDYCTKQLKAFEPSIDHSISASFQHMKGQNNSAFGVVFGRQDNKNQFEFFVSANGYFQIRQRSYGSKINLKKWTQSSYVRKGNFVTNTLKIKQEGYDWKFYINGNFVHSMSSKKWFGNEVGVAIGQSQKVSIDYISVKQIGGSTYMPPVVNPPVVENIPPEIQIFEPNLERGFKALSRKSVRVSGKAVDRDGIATLQINGIAAAISSDGSFATDIMLAPGENTIRIVATDTRGAASEKSFAITRSGNEKPVLQNQKRLALLIGNSEYHKGGSLRNPVNDVRAMAKALERIGFEVIKRENCTQKDIMKAMDEFGEKLSGFDAGLFFYAGHGIQVNGSNYLVPVDANLSTSQDVSYDCVDAGRIMGKMEAAKNKTNIIILDACRDNPFERSWSRSAQGKGLAFMNAPTGSFIAYSTSPGKTASDGHGQNGLYTESLLKYLDQSGLTIEEVFKKVRTNVKEQSGGKQIPWESTSLEGTFYFRR